MSDADYVLALKLQNEFNNELEPVLIATGANIKKNPNIGFNFLQSDTYKKPRSNDQGLADPSWEFVDPTPDVHALFIAFDLRFFWGSLKSVVVRWSKRMYSCAGICSYQGRGGLCTVSLSEPLLKLRPRKDLVETLLHEMIHAYLFLMSNNRDRDGHGPEFQKHMFRINNDAGVNITIYSELNCVRNGKLSPPIKAYELHVVKIVHSVEVYHTFHDEVRLYKTHWWRCTGPCTKQAPYFGLIKRTCNRAPGPTDRWWNDHKNRCDGNFMKIREPEKQKKASVTSQPQKNNTPMRVNDIRDYWGGKENKGGNVPNAKVNKGSGTLVIYPKSSKTQTGTSTTGSTNKSINQSKTGKDISGYLVPTVRTPPSTAAGNLVNVKGFKDINSDSNTRSSTERLVFVGPGNILGKTNRSDPEKYLVHTVRNHWADKYPQNKRGLSKDVEQPQKIKKQKIIDNSTTTKLSTTRSVNTELVIQEVIELGSDIENDDTDVLKSFDVKVNCPICDKAIDEKSINDHLDVCMNESQVSSEFSGEDSLIEDYSNDLNDIIKPNNVIKCSQCNKAMLREDLDVHLENCRSLDLTTYSSNATGCANVDHFQSILKAAGYSADEISAFSILNLDSSVTSIPTTSGSDKDNPNIKSVDIDKEKNYFNESVNAGLIGSQICDDDDDENYLGDMSQSDIPNNFPCPKCFIFFSLQDMNSHLDICL